MSIAIEFFEKMGHEIRAIVPQMRLKSGMSTDPRLLESLHADNKVMFTPCKSLPGRNAISYDDRILMQMANELDAAIISNDNYRDLIDESPGSKLNVTIIFYSDIKYLQMCFRLEKNNRNTGCWILLV